MSEYETKEYEQHIRSNESIRDGMDGVLEEPQKPSNEEEHCDPKTSTSTCKCHRCVINHPEEF